VCVSKSCSSAGVGEVDDAVAAGRRRADLREGGTGRREGGDGRVGWYQLTLGYSRESAQ